MTDSELIAAIEAQRDLMVAVATGGPRIRDVELEYTQRRNAITEALRDRGIADANPYSDLWRWYGKWSGGDLPSYQSRRKYLAELFEPLLERIRSGGVQVGTGLFPEPTGWVRVDRGIEAVRKRLETASTEEEYQTVGLLCREVLTSLAQFLYDPSRHHTLDGVSPSSTDAKRMIEAFIAVELAGSTHEEARKHARAAIDLANALQHRRTATFRDAALCAEATSAAVNFLAIVSGRRDPST